MYTDKDDIEAEFEEIILFTTLFQLSKIRNQKSHISNLIKKLIYISRN